MGVGRSEDTFIKFLHAFNFVKALYKKMRGFLLPYKYGLLIETPSEPQEPSEMLHSPAIQAFDNAIASISTS